MAHRIDSPTIIDAAGSAGKIIQEFVGAVNTGNSGVSIAHMKSPAGWNEPAQTPEFDEYSIVLNGVLRVETKDRAFDVAAGQAAVATQGEWVKYSTPDAEAEYIAICIPAFTPDRVHRV